MSETEKRSILLARLQQLMLKVYKHKLNNDVATKIMDGFDLSHMITNTSQWIDIISDEDDLAPYDPDSRIISARIYDNDQIPDIFKHASSSSSPVSMPMPMPMHVQPDVTSYNRIVRTSTADKFKITPPSTTTRRTKLDKKPEYELYHSLYNKNYQKNIQELNGTPIRISTSSRGRRHRGGNGGDDDEEMESLSSQLKQAFKNDSRLIDDFNKLIICITSTKSEEIKSQGEILALQILNKYNIKTNGNSIDQYDNLLIQV